LLLDGYLGLRKEIETDGEIVILPRCLIREQSLETEAAPKEDVAGSLKNFLKGTARAPKDDRIRKCPAPQAHRWSPVGRPLHLGRKLVLARETATRQGGERNSGS